MINKRIKKVILYVLILLLFFYFIYPHATVFLSNKFIDVSYVKLRSNPEYIEKYLKETVNRVDENNRYFNKSKGIEFYTAITGFFVGRVNRIVITNPIYSVFGIHPGELYDVAEKKLTRYGFSKVKDRWQFNFLNISVSMECQSIDDKLYVSLIDITDNGRLPIFKSGRHY